MDMASVFEWFAQESWAAAELTHEQPQREIWLRLALMWALAALRSREEAEALGENAAVYLRGGFEISCQACSSSSKTLASFKSRVWKPSVNQP